MVARGVGRELAASVAAHRDILYRIQHPCGMIIPCFSPVVNTFFCGFGGSRNFRDIVTKTTGYSGVVWLKGRPGRHGGKGRTTHPAGACPAGCRLTLPSLSPAGAYLLCCPPTLPLACFTAPIPPPPFPSGEGGDFLFSYARGFAPCIPGAEPETALARPKVPVCLRGTVPAAKERGDRGRGTSAFEMVLSPGAGRANAGGVQPPSAGDS